MLDYRSVSGLFIQLTIEKGMNFKQHTISETNGLPLKIGHPQKVNISSSNH